MREILVKYSGDCAKCGETLEVGAKAVYERRVGIFCSGCAPTDPEEIRAVRQEGADRKADRLQGWADKRIKKGEKQDGGGSLQFHDTPRDWGRMHL